MPQVGRAVVGKDINNADVINRLISRVETLEKKLSTLTPTASTGINRSTTESFQIHNSTIGKQGGSIGRDEYFHLNRSEHTEATQYADTDKNGLLKADDWDTFNEKYDGLPNQSGHADEFLSTDGSVESWKPVPESHDAVTVQDSNTVDLELTNQLLTASLKAQNSTTIDLSILESPGLIARLNSTLKSNYDAAYAHVSSTGNVHLSDHAALLSLLSDDHTQYALLAGRLGGQSLTGGTEAGDALHLNSTSHATKGMIYLCSAAVIDCVNNRFGLGKIPDGKFDIYKADSAEMIAAIVDRDFSGAGNWTGTNWTVNAGSFAHTPGSTADAVLNYSNFTGQIITNRRYKVRFSLTITAGTLTVKLGTQSGIVVSTTVGSGNYLAVLTAPANNSNLIFTPSSTFNGSIDNVSMTEVGVMCSITEDGNMGLGTNSPTQAMHMRKEGNAQLFLMESYYDLNTSNVFRSTKYRGYIDNPKAVLDNDTLFNFQMGGYDGTSARTNQAGFGGFVVGNWTDSNLGTLIRLNATPLNSTTANAVAEFYGDKIVLFKSVGIGQTSPTASLHLPASTTGVASLRIPEGVAPSFPNNGDVWSTPSGLFARIEGVTYNLTAVGAGDGDVVGPSSSTDGGMCVFDGTDGKKIKQSASVQLDCIKGRSKSVTQGVDTNIFEYSLPNISAFNVWIFWGVEGKNATHAFSYAGGYIGASARKDSFVPDTNSLTGLKLAHTNNGTLNFTIGSEYDTANNKVTVYVNVAPDITTTELKFNFIVLNFSSQSITFL